MKLSLKITDLRIKFKSERNHVLAKIFLALIHNNEISRLTYLREKLLEIETQLSEAESETCLIQVGSLETPCFSKFSFLRRKFENEKYSLRQRGVSCVQRLVSLSRFMSTHLRILIMKRIRRSKYRESSPFGLFGQVRVEDEVSRKHTDVLDQFLDSKFDYLVVFESDSIIKSAEQLCLQIIKNASLPNSHVISLFNSHFTLDELGISMKNVVKSENLDQVSDNRQETNSYTVPRLHTNTLCCYGISRPLAFALKSKLTFIEKKPLPPADWMFDQALQLVGDENDAAGIESKTIFFYPSLVENGSLLGAYTSGIR